MGSFDNRYGSPPAYSRAAATHDRGWHSYCTTSVFDSQLLGYQLHATVVVEVLLLTAIQWDPRLARVSAVHNNLGPHTVLYRTKAGYIQELR